MQCANFPISWDGKRQTFLRSTRGSVIKRITISASRMLRVAIDPRACDLKWTNGTRNQFFMKDKWLTISFPPSCRNLVRVESVRSATFFHCYKSGWLAFEAAHFAIAYVSLCKKPAITWGALVCVLVCIQMETRIMYFGCCHRIHTPL